MLRDDSERGADVTGGASREETPAHAIATLGDGTRVMLRPADVTDTERLRAFHDGLSRETIRGRFLAASAAEPHALAECPAREDDAAVTLVAALTASDDPIGGTHVRDDVVLGVARYAPTAGGEAEVALVVADEYQRRGIGMLLMEHLAAHAVARGISTFVADVLSANIRVLSMIRRAAIPVVSGGSGGELCLRLDLRADLRAASGLERRADGACEAVLANRQS